MAEPDLVDEAKEIIALMEKRGARVPIPEDVVVANELSPLARANRVPVDEVAQDDMILDVGPKTAAKLSMMLAHAGTIVWNGPLGVFEIDQFGGGTKMIAAAIAHSPAFSIAGGVIRWQRSRSMELRIKWITFQLVGALSSNSSRVRPCLHLPCLLSALRTNHATSNKNYCYSGTRF